MDLIEKILLERPTFHRAETEIGRPFDPGESSLPQAQASLLSKAAASGKSACHGLEAAVVHFLANSVRPKAKTLETGAGISTLVFAIKEASHIAITPNGDEIEAIRKYARHNNISLDSVEFIPESSDHYLPRCEVSGLDLALLDGKHAFPWPMVDWFYTADRLKQGGLMVVDDTQMRSVSLLRDFMAADPGWKLVREFGGKTHAFQKMRASIHDVTWHMQPWTFGNNAPPSLGHTWARRLYGKLQRLLSR